jgi:hypothetical protein
MNDYSNRVQVDGQIYENEYKKAENQPDKQGQIELTKEFLRPIVEAVKAGQTPKVRAAVWERTAKTSGKPYWFVRFEYTPEPDITDDDIPF